MLETYWHAPLHDNARPKSLLHPIASFLSNDPCKVSCTNRLGPIVGAANRRVENSANEATCQNGSRSAGRHPEIATNEANSGSPVASVREETGELRRTKPAWKPKIQVLCVQNLVSSQCLAAWNYRLNEESIRAGLGPAEKAAASTSTAVAR